MPRFDFRSPGASAAEAIQELLTQRKMEARQAMLDKLSEENMQHQWKASDAQIDIATRGQKIAEDRERREADAQTETTWRNQIGDLPDDANLESLKESNPELYNELVKRNMRRVEPSKTPMVSSATSYSPTPKMGPLSDDELANEALGAATNIEAPTQAGPEIPGGEFFVGTKDFQKQRRREAEYDRIMQNPDFAKADELTKAMMLAKIDEKFNIPESAIAGPRRVIPIPPGSRTPVELGPRDQAIEMNYPPQVGAWSRPVFIGMQGSNAVMQQPDGSISLQPVPGTGELEGKPGTVSGNRPVAPPQAWAAFNASLRRGTNERDEDWDVRKQAGRTALVSQVQTLSPPTKQWLVGAIGKLNSSIDAGRPLPTLEILVSAANADLTANQLPPLTPREVADLQSVLGTVISSLQGQ